MFDLVWLDSTREGRAKWLCAVKRFWYIKSSIDLLIYTAQYDKSQNYRKGRRRGGGDLSEQIYMQDNVPTQLFTRLMKVNIVL